MCALSDDTAGEIYNLGSYEHINLKDLAELMIRIYGRGECRIIPFPEERKVIDIGDYYSDFGKIKDTLNWEPKVSLEEGIEKTLKYFSENFPYYV